MILLWYFSEDHIILFVDEANLGIPQKFASRGMTIIPHDFLPSENLGTFDTMYWAAGKQILRSAKFVKDHPQLFGVYITNFSCGSRFIPHHFLQKHNGE